MATVEVDSEADIDAALHDAIGRDLERRAYEVESTAKRLVRMQGTGRIYTTRFFRKHGKLYAYGRRTPHQASAPGMPPASDTGRLLNSIHHVLGEDGEGQYAHIGSDLDYSLWLELGTRYMAPRPFLRPSLRAAAG